MKFSQDRKVRSLDCTKQGDNCPSILKLCYTEGFGKNKDLLGEEDSGRASVKVNVVRSRHE